MKTVSLKELKSELNTLQSQQVIELCVKLAKYKKENKELLTYLLFESYDEQLYVKEVKNQVDELFGDVNKNNLYLAKKTLRKILRTVNKYIKYSGSKQTELDLLIYFCSKLRRTELPLHTNTALGNIYARQIQRIKKAMTNLHEDLQYDYLEELKPLL
jgi:Zn-dependent M32 family carboxypeptidase